MEFKYPTYTPFARIIADDFEFLKKEHGYKYLGIREEGDDPRDDFVCAEYVKRNSQITIAWSEVAQGLSVRVQVATGTSKHENNSVLFGTFFEFFTKCLGLNLAGRTSTSQHDGKSKSIFFEPFIEFVSDGAVKPIVPQIFPKMSMRKLNAAGKERRRVFQDGIEVPMRALATKLRDGLVEIESASSELIEKYEEWYNMERT